MEINRNNVMELINKCDAKPDKDYGQNFLIEPSLSSKIVSFLDVQKDDEVLEIGPGLGSLTHFLSLTQANLTAVDIDNRMINFLKIFYGNDSHIKLIENDIRKVNISPYTKIIGNLPYNITSELVTFLLKNANQCNKMVLMCQTEAYSRFSDLNGKEYGPISILLHLLGNTKKLLPVKAGSFQPVPKCGSLVFEIVLDKDIDRNLAISVYEFSKQMFINRRKTILNNLVNYLRNKDLAFELLTKANIDPSLRPECISPVQYKELFNLLTLAK